MRLCAALSFFMGFFMCLIFRPASNRRQSNESARSNAVAKRCGGRARASRSEHTEPASTHSIRQTARYYGKTRCGPTHSGQVQQHFIEPTRLPTTGNQCLGRGTHANRRTLDRRATRLTIFCVDVFE